jgi:hypothetical protein
VSAGTIDRVDGVDPDCTVPSLGLHDPPTPACSNDEVPAEISTSARGHHSCLPTGIEQISEVELKGLAIKLVDVSKGLVSDGFSPSSAVTAKEKQTKDEDH